MLAPAFRWGFFTVFTGSFSASFVKITQMETNRDLIIIRHLGEKILYYRDSTLAPVTRRLAGGRLILVKRHWGNYLEILGIGQLKIKNIRAQRTRPIRVDSALGCAGY